jgi:hypothetical protein
LSVPIGIVALVAAVGVGLAAAAWSYLATKRKRRTVFGGREPVAAEEVFARYYADSGLDERVVVQLWSDCAAKLKVPAEKLRPTDRFEHELAVADFWSSLDDLREDLADYALSRAKKLGATIDLKSPKTLDDLIRQLALIETRTSA